MQFALLGDHPDGLDTARALAETGRHEITYYCGPATGSEFLKRWRLEPKREGDAEAVLADPAVDTVIVAGKPASRAAQLRRALQAERHVLCVHPADASPDVAYEAAMIQGDSHKLLFPILPETLHPALDRLVELLTDQESTVSSRIRLIEMERWFTEGLGEDDGGADIHPSLRGWDVLRHLGGEIAEVSALARGESMELNQPVAVTGLFLSGGLFRASFLPGQAEMRWQIRAVTESSHIELLFHDGWPGPATLTWTDDNGELQTECWQAWNPWPALVEAFENACSENLKQRRSVADFPVLADKSEHIQVDGNAQRRIQSLSTKSIRTFPTWHDETRLLELDDAARRSVAKRRTNVLELQEVTEEATFKGTMTLVGCSIIWISLMLLILSAWLPWLGWLIIPAFVLFLIVQIALRWVARSAQNNTDDPQLDSSVNSQ